MFCTHNLNFCFKNFAWQATGGKRLIVMVLLFKVMKLRDMGDLGKREGRNKKVITIEEGLDYLPLKFAFSRNSFILSTFSGNSGSFWLRRAQNSGVKSVDLRSSAFFLEGLRMFIFFDAPAIL